MPSITIPGWKTFLYNEVWKVTELRDNCIYKTISTGKFISNEEKQLLPDGFIVSSVSTSLILKDEVTLPLWKIPNPVMPKQ